MIEVNVGKKFLVSTLLLIFQLFRGILNILPKCVNSYYIMIL